jgi:predicted ester cyclase
MPNEWLLNHSTFYRDRVQATLPSIMTTTTIQERLGRTITPELYLAIRRLWIEHSKAEDKRDLQGLINTLTEDCVYENVPTGHRWEGHEGARQFYTTFLGAFPDVKFDLTDIVIGPQGVFEVAAMTGTHLGSWLGAEPTGKAVRATVMILFPWDSAAGKFAGEKIYSHGIFGS